MIPGKKQASAWMVLHSIDRPVDLARQLVWHLILERCPLAFIHQV